MQVHGRVILATASISVLALTSCGSAASGTGTDVTRTMVEIQGNDQIGLWADTTAIRPAVRVTDHTGQPVSGVVVTFAAAGPSNGSVTAPTSTTDADGVATVGSWELGTPGTNVLTATAAGVNGSPVQFTATSKDRLSLVRTAGVNQSAPAGMPVPISPAIQVVGVYSQTPIAGASVAFTITDGGGTLSGAVATTDAQGFASVGSWTLGPVAGANQITATVAWPGSPSVTFAATGTP